VAALIAALDDGAEAVRAAAAAALGRLGDPAAVGPLAKALGRPDWHLRRAAAQALASFADPRAAEALTKALAEDPHWAVRAAAATALGRRKEAAAVPPLLAGLADGHWYVRRAAHGALTVVTGQDLPADGGAWQTWWAGRGAATPGRNE
jgi:HEAT repeat protein